MPADQVHCGSCRGANWRARGTGLSTTAARSVATASRSASSRLLQLMGGHLQAQCTALSRQQRPHRLCLAARVMQQQGRL